MAIDYVYKNPSIQGEPCPVCGKKSWNIFQCDQCGSVFCKHCHPERINIDSETDSIDVACSCGSTTLFI